MIELNIKIYYSMTLLLLIVSRSIFPLLIINIGDLTKTEYDILIVDIIIYILQKLENIVEFVTFSYYRVISLNYIS